MVVCPGYSLQPIQSCPVLSYPLLSCRDEDEDAGEGEGDEGSAKVGKVSWG